MNLQTEVASNLYRKIIRLLILIFMRDGALELRIVQKSSFHLKVVLHFAFAIKLFLFYLLLHVVEIKGACSTLIEFPKGKYQKPLTPKIDSIALKINGATFLKPVTFFYKTFSGEVNIGGESTFLQGCDFSGSKFLKDVDVTGTTFLQKQDVITDGINFTYASFSGQSSQFSYSRFYGNALFNDIDFNSQKSTFFECQFDNGAVFSGSSFKNNLLFFSCIFKNRVSFYNIILPDTFLFASIDLADLKGEIDLSTARLNEGKKTCFINLEGTDISKVKLRYQQFCLYFFNATTFEQKCSIYEQLLNKQKKDGFTNSYKKLDLEFRKLKIENENNFVSTMNDFIERLWWNYGYDKSLIFRNTLIILLIFSLINMFLFKYLLFKVYVVDDIITKYKAIKRSSSSKLVYWYKLVPISFYYTCLIFFGLRIHLDKLRYRSPFSILYFFLIYSSGVVCLTYMIGFIIKN